VLSRWISADPAIAKYLPTGEQDEEGRLPGYGGVFNPLNLNLYGYTYQNPVKYTDPDGELGFIPILIMAAGAYFGQAFLAPDIANAPVPGEAAVQGPSALEQASAMATGAFIARIAATEGLKAVAKAAAKEAVEQTTGIPTDVGAIGKAARPGRLGGAAHKAKVEEVAEKIKKRGLVPIKELYIRTPGGKKRGRFADVAGLDPQKQIKELHQVGKQTKSGMPVSRERASMKDMEKATGVKPEFHPYNKPNEQ
jgi:hypothetical protein